MRDHPGLRKQIRLHSAANPWLLIAAFVVASIAGLFLEHYAFSRVQISDRSMAPQIDEGETVLLCQLPSCRKKIAVGDLLLIETPDRTKIRRIAAMPGEQSQLRNQMIYPLPPKAEPTNLTLPRAGFSTDPASWSPLAFDALLPALVEELDTLQREQLRIRMRWVSGRQETIEERFSDGWTWLRYSDMERHASLLRSHRPGIVVNWERRLLLGDAPLRDHLWKNDHLLLEPTARGWSWWVLPLDSVMGRVFLF